MVYDKIIIEKLQQLKVKTYLISFVGYRGKEHDFGNTMVNSPSIALYKDKIAENIAKGTGLDKVIILSVYPLTPEEQEIVDLTMPATDEEK